MSSALPQQGERPRGTCYSDDPRQWCRWNNACRACVHLAPTDSPREEEPR